MTHLCCCRRRIGSLFSESVDFCLAALGLCCARFAFRVDCLGGGPGLYGGGEKSSESFACSILAGDCTEVAVFSGAVRSVLEKGGQFYLWYIFLWSYFEHFPDVVNSTLIRSFSGVAGSSSTESSVGL